jgi:hypothetical protein
MEFEDRTPEGVQSAAHELESKITDAFRVSTLSDGEKLIVLMRILNRAMIAEGVRGMEVSLQQLGHMAFAASTGVVGTIADAIFVGVLFPEGGFTAHFGTRPNISKESEAALELAFKEKMRKYVEQLEEREESR